MTTIQYIWQRVARITLFVFGWLQKLFELFRRCEGPLIGKIDLPRKNWLARLDRWGNAVCSPFEALRLLANVAVVGLYFVFLLSSTLGFSSLMQAFAPLLIPVVVIELFHVGSLLIESRKLGKAQTGKAKLAKDPLAADEQKRFYGFIWLASSVFTSFAYLAKLPDCVEIAVVFFVAWSLAISLFAISLSRFPALIFPAVFFISPFVPILVSGSFSEPGNPTMGIEAIFNMARFLTTNPGTWALFLIITALASVITGFFVPRYRIRSVRNVLNWTSLVSNAAILVIVFFTVRPQSLHEAALSFFESDAAMYAGLVLSTLAVSSVIVSAIAALRLFDAKLNAKHFLGQVESSGRSLSACEIKALKAAYLYNGGDEMIWNLIEQQTARREDSDFLIRLAAGDEAQTRAFS